MPKKASSSPAAPSPPASAPAPSAESAGAAAAAGAGWKRRLRSKCRAGLLRVRAGSQASPTPASASSAPEAAPASAGSRFFPEEPPGLSVQETVCDDRGKLVLETYKAFKAHFALESSRDAHPNPERPGLSAEDIRRGEPTVGLRYWCDAKGAGWIAQRRSAEASGSSNMDRWFSVRTWGSWRLAFLLARLQRDVWNAGTAGSSSPAAPRAAGRGRGSGASRGRGRPRGRGRGGAPADEAAAGTDAAEWLAFTPAEVDPQRCLARIWRCGLGGQCVAGRASGEDLCERHREALASPTGLLFGFVDGPIPPEKLEEFRRAAVSRGADRGSRRSAPAAASTVQPNAKRRRGRLAGSNTDLARRSKNLGDAIDAAFEEQRKHVGPDGLSGLLDETGAIRLGEMDAAVALMSSVEADDVDGKKALLSAVRRAVEEKSLQADAFACSDGVDALRIWLEAALQHPDAATGEHQGLIMDAFEVLQFVPMSIEMLRASGIGRILNTIRDTCEAAVSTAAGALVMRWQSDLSAQLQQPADAATSATADAFVAGDVDGGTHAEGAKDAASAETSDSSDTSDTESHTRAEAAAAAAAMPRSAEKSAAVAGVARASAVSADAAAAEAVAAAVAAVKTASPAPAAAVPASASSSAPAPAPSPAPMAVANQAARRRRGASEATSWWKR
eukprot:TRINITY_DN2860_c4_g1_i3.p1 TRINITY_DN2860_c4_g1~~TRINITY_DN2860_c4_g1_i3.p1  ORF type:complete len:674 (-),score=155.10 TRINITY_DN2860_c4_g1_i3:431-2452(-)